MKHLVTSALFALTAGLAGCGSSNSTDIGVSATLSSANADVGLTCTCHRSPGGDPYTCAPVQKTCYGGPGNYPYACDSCPE